MSALSPVNGTVRPLGASCLSAAAGEWAHIAARAVNIRDEAARLRAELTVRPDLRERGPVAAWGALACCELAMCIDGRRAGWLARCAAEHGAPAAALARAMARRAAAVHGRLDGRRTRREVSR